MAHRAGLDIALTVLLVQVEAQLVECVLPAPREPSPGNRYEAGAEQEVIESGPPLWDGFNPFRHKDAAVISLQKVLP